MGDLSPTWGRDAAMADAVDGCCGPCPSAPGTGLLSMGGHEDGIVAYGSDLDAAGAALFDEARARRC